MRIAVIGAGINGVCCAIALANRGLEVTVFDQNTPFSETSSKSSKMLHGGIRYLESGNISFVKAALEDRAWWVRNAPHCVNIKRFYVPIYKNKSRSRYKLYLGVKIYEHLAGSYSLGTSKYHGLDETLTENPNLSSEDIIGSVSYMDVQMEDVSLSNWLLEKAQSLGVKIVTRTKVLKIFTDGQVQLSGETRLSFDKVVNACGPWVNHLLTESDIQGKYSLAFVKGSHLVINRKIDNPVVVQIPKERRVIFMLPIIENMLLGTTEVIHDMGKKIECSSEEMIYLIHSANEVLKEKLYLDDVISSYAGVRSIVSQEKAISKLSTAKRDSVVETIGNIIVIYGGKWTSGMRLGESIANLISQSK